MLVAPMLSCWDLNIVLMLRMQGIGLSVNGTFTYVGRFGMASNSKVMRSPKDLISYSAGTIFSREIFIHLISSCMFTIVLVVFYITSMFFGDADGEP